VDSAAVASLSSLLAAFLSTNNSHRNQVRCCAALCCAALCRARRLIFLRPCRLVVTRCAGGEGVFGREGCVHAHGASNVLMRVMSSARAAVRCAHAVAGAACRWRCALRSASRRAPRSRSARWQRCCCDRSSQFARSGLRCPRATRAACSRRCCRGTSLVWIARQSPAAACSCRWRERLCCLRDRLRSCH
jgi:hypothetical protein